MKYDITKQTAPKMPKLGIVSGVSAFQGSEGYHTLFSNIYNYLIMNILYKR